MQLCSYSDCLRDVVAVFAGSHFFQQFKAYASAQLISSTTENGSSASSVDGTSTGDKAGPESGQIMSCDYNRDTQLSVSHCCTSHLSSVSLPSYLSDSTMDDNVTVTDAVTSNKDLLVGTKAEVSTLKPCKSSRQSKACQKSASKIKPVSNRQKSRKAKASFSDNTVDETLKTGNINSAGITHCPCYLLINFFCPFCS